VTGTVAVVIITFNRRDEVIAAARHACSLGEASSVVVVDNGSTDGTVQALRDSGLGISVVEVGRNIGAAARNVGVAATLDPYVAFCDDDCRWEPGSLTRAADLLEHHPAVGLVCGLVLVDPGGRRDPTCDQMRNSPLPDRVDTPGRRILGFLAGASMARRCALDATGGFEPRLFLGAEEQLLAIDLRRAGWELVYCDDVVVRHHPSARRCTPGVDREAIHQRNELCVSWLRHPARVAVRRTLDQLRSAAMDGTARRALLAFSAHVPWALRNRVVDALVVDELRAVLVPAPRAGRREPG
jgi:GT2 family glycosyltransferase